MQTRNRVDFLKQHEEASTNMVSLMRIDEIKKKNIDTKFVQKVTTQSFHKEHFKSLTSNTNVKFNINNLIQKNITDLYVNSKKENSNIFLTNSL
jgi:hypothetical protein